MPGYMKVLAALSIGLMGALLGPAKPSSAAQQNPVTAIDILLEPDAAMLRHAQANNARLLEAFPKGFALDEAHRPHITLIQRFVRTADLDKVYAAAEKVLAGTNVTRMKLEAFKYYYAPGNDVGVAGIVARPTPDLLKLQQDLIAAVAPFTVETGTIGAFTAAHGDPATDAILIGYVATFVPKQAGAHFNPHVSTGVAPHDYLDKMLAEPFAPFTFSPAGAAVYQLGPFGTAAKKLKAWDSRSATQSPAMAADKPATGRALIATETVNVDNFIRAETDNYFRKKADDGFYGRIAHIREAPSLDKQLVIRMNRDTLYSFGIFDLTTPVTIIKPDTGSRFQSMVVINQDHYIKLVAYDPGEYTLTRDKIGTRYVHVAFRTLANADDPADVKAAHAAQDAITWRQQDAGKLELPDWDQESLNKVRAAIIGVAPYTPDAQRMFGDKGEVDPVRHFIGTAAGFGGNRTEDAVYLNVTPANNDGKQAYVLHVPKVPVDGFWSISLYNADGFFQKNPQNAYSVNNLTAKKNSDGTVTVHFGGDAKQSNYLAIMPGWNYIVRLYRPRQEIIDGSWTFPAAEPVK